MPLVKIKMDHPMRVQAESKLKRDHLFNFLINYILNCIIDANVMFLNKHLIVSVDKSY